MQLTLVDILFGTKATTEKRYSEIVIRNWLPGLVRSEGIRG